MDINTVKNMIRIGKISSVNGTECTARVTFGDKDSLVSAELPIITIGSKDTRGYWLPEVGTQVLCVFQPNTSGRGVCDGFVIGAFYSKVDRPPKLDADVRSIRFADGSFIRYDHGNIEINAKGTLTLRGAKININ